MNYATQNHIGNYQYTQEENTKNVIQTVRRVRKMDENTKRRKPNSERQTKISTHRDAANGILRCTFLPKLKLEKSTEASKQKAEKTERDFYHSLSKVAKRYHIEPMQTQHYNYPYNIVLGLWDMQEKLKHTVKGWDGLHLAKSRKKVFLARKERYNTSTTLYYIPVIPLFHMLKDPKRKKNAQVLLSVCSYLYRIADIPYYRQQGSFLHDHYEMHSDWIAQETDISESSHSELRKVEKVGDIMERKIRNPINLKVLEQRLSQFKIRNTFDQECWNVASNAFKLFAEYPTTSIFRNLLYHIDDPYYEPCDSDIIRMEKYISFCADTEGWLNESINECINNEFSECGEIEEPTIYKPIDSSRIAGNNLEFEKRLFDLIDDLCTLLYIYKSELK